MSMKALASIALKVAALALGGLVVIMANVGDFSPRTLISLLGLGLFAVALAGFLGK